MDTGLFGCEESTMSAKRSSLRRLSSVVSSSRWPPRRDALAFGSQSATPSLIAGRLSPHAASAGTTRCCRSRRTSACRRARGRQGQALRAAADAAVLDRRCARRPHHRAGRDGRMAPPGAEPKNGSTRRALRQIRSPDPKLSPLHGTGAGRAQVRASPSLRSGHR